MFAQMRLWSWHPGLCSALAGLPHPTQPGVSPPGTEERCTPTGSSCLLRATDIAVTVSCT